MRLWTAACVGALALAIGCGNKQEQANRLFELGLSYAAQQNIPAAAQSFERAVQLAPKHVHAHRNLADAYFFLQRYDEAVREIETTIQLDPSYREQGCMKAGLARERQNRIPEAINYYEQVVQMSPSHVGLRLQLGHLYWGILRLPEARRQFIKAITLMPNNSPAFNGLGIVSAATGQHSAAIEAFERAAAIDPKNAMVLHNLALEYINLRWFKEAEKQLRDSLALVPDYLQSHVHLARSLEEQNRRDEALASYERVLKDRPRDPYLICRAGTLLLKQGKTAEAIERFKLALQYHPRDEYFDDTSAHYLLGTAYARLNQPAEARAEYEQAAKSSPMCMDAKKTLADLYRKEGKTKEADELEKAMDTFESQIGAQKRAADLGFAGVSALRKKDYATAVTKLQEAVKAVPEFLIGLHEELGRALFAQGKLEDAKKEFAAVVEKDKEAADSLYHLALIAKKTGDAAEAIELLRTVSNIAPYKHEAHMELAHMLMASGKTEEALRAYDDAIRFKTDWTEAYEVAARAYEKAGKPEEAQKRREALKKLLEPPAPAPVTTPPSEKALKKPAPAAAPQTTTPVEKSSKPPPRPEKESKTKP